MVELCENKEECCGCTACVNICPTTAIVMQEDKKGFLYPCIDEKKCIECRLCQNVCALRNNWDSQINFKDPYVYAVKHKDNSIRMSSTSGGTFTAISDYIIDKGGVVFGVAFDENMNAVYQKAETKTQRDKFRGSKYVQSDLKNTFIEIKKLLNNGKYVLFTGTPCHTAGLHLYLNNVNVNMNRLFLCDIVCHGVPSPLIWKKYVSDIESKINGKLISYKFRDKNVGWRGANVTAYFDNNKIIHDTDLIKIYSNLYFDGLITRECCKNCKYTNLHRPSDLTIADFWGIEKHMKDFDDNKGVSLVLINTPKGQNLFENIQENMIIIKSNTTDCLQPQLMYPSIPSLKQNKFWNDYFSHGYRYVSKKYTRYGFKNKMKQFCAKILKDKIINGSKN